MFIGQDWEVRRGFSLLTSQESTLCFSEQKHSAVRVFAGSLGLACRASKTARCKVQFMQLPEVLNVWVSHVQNLPKGDVKHTEQSRTEFGSMKNGAGFAPLGLLTLVTPVDISLASKRALKATATQVMDYSSVSKSYL